MRIGTGGRATESTAQDRICKTARSDSPAPFRSHVLGSIVELRIHVRDIRPSRPRPSAPGHDPFLWSDRSWHLQFMKFSGKQEFSHCNFECVQRRTQLGELCRHNRCIILRERDAGRAPLPSLVASARLLSSLPSPQSPPPHAYLFSSSTASLASPPAGPSPSAHSPWARSEPRCRVRATG